MECCAGVSGVIGLYPLVYVCGCFAAFASEAQFKEIWPI